MLCDRCGCVLTRNDRIDRFDSAGGDRIARSLLKSMPAEKSILKDGGSAAISPDARYILAPAGLTRDVLFVEIDLTRCDHATFYLDTHGHYARPDVFELRVNTRRNPGVRLSDTQDQ